MTLVVVALTSWRARELRELRTLFILLAKKQTRRKLQRQSPHLREQRLPLLVRQAAPVPIRPCVLPPVVEEPLVVVLGLEGLDLAVDEVVELGEIVDELPRQFEVHGVSRQSGGRTVPG